MRNKIALFTCVFLMSFSVYSQEYWRPIFSNTNKDLYSISFGSEQVGFICGKDSLLLKSIDGGKTWNPIKPKGINFNQGGFDLIDVQFVNAQVGYMVQSNYKTPTYMGTLFKTSDGGINWTNINSVNVATYKSLYFSEDNGFIMGSAFFEDKTVCKQVNGNWQGVNSFSWSPQEFIRAIDFYDSLTGIVGGDSGQVFRTFNGGKNWQRVQAARRNPIYCLKYITKDFIIGGTGNVGSYGSTIMSVDGGNNWSESSSLFLGYHPEIKSIVVSKKDSIISVGQLFQKGGFIEWIANSNKRDTLVVKQRLNTVRMKNDSIAFIVGDSGTILCNGISETSNLKKNPPFFTASIFPNPTLGMLNINCQVNFDFQFFNMEGRLLYTELNCQPVCQIDMSQFAKGLYVLVLTSNKQKSQVFKVQVD